MPENDLNKIESNCEICTWYLGNRECPAFEDLKIPDEVWNGTHDKEVKGQEKGILFVKKGELL